MTGGSIDFDDHLKTHTHTLTDITLAMPLISNFKHTVDIFVQPSFSATINGTPCTLTGQSKPFANSLETRAELNITDMHLATYLPYVPATLNFKMPSSHLNMRLVLNYIQQAGKTTHVSVKGDVELANLEIVSPDNNPILTVSALDLRGITCGVNSRDLVIDTMSVHGVHMALAREKDGILSLQKLVAADTQTGASPATQFKVQDDAPAWSVLVKKFTCAEGIISFTDQAPHTPVQFRIAPIRCTLANISTSAKTPGEIDCTCGINGAGTLDLQGTFTIDTPGANLNLDLSGLDIRFAQSYLPETLLLDLTDGTLGLSGSLDFNQTPNTVPAIVWQGDLRLTNFAAAHRNNHDELLTCAALDLQSIHTGTSPLFVDIKTVKLAEFRLQPVVAADGTVNLTSLRAPAVPAPAGARPAEKPLPQVNIGSIVFEKGRLQFVDKSIIPRYRAELTDIDGTISSISTNREAQTNIRLNARLNQYAPFAAIGTIDPFRSKLTANIQVLCNNIDLSHFSPYSGKFLGRLIEKGSLSCELAYTIRDNQLTSQNKVFIDQFTLGKSVVSKDATSLPVGLAIALLKDRKGGIHLNLPVSGNLDDPSFKVRKVILHTLVNILKKAATSPFALISSLIPGGVDISSIPFACGTAALSVEATKKLDLLAGLLAEKPALSLEIRAGAETDRDREGLREEMILHKMRLLKFKDLSRGKKAGLTPDTVSIPSREYEQYLWQAYKAEPFQKQTVLGMTKKLPAVDMKKLLLEHTMVSDEDMQDLRQQRGLAVKQYLTETAKMPPERLFIIGSRIDRGNDPAGCCVEFTLK